MYFSDKLKKMISFGLKAVVVFLITMVFLFWIEAISFRKTMKIEEKPKKKIFERKLVDMPFYVFSTSVVPYPKNFAPSGYMGDKNDIKMTGSYDVKLKKKYPCLKLTYDPTGEKGWSGIMWQNPANNWGEFEGRYDLSKATKLTFWARGDKGGEVVEFKVGGVGPPFSDSLNLTSGEIVLEKKWIKYVFHLEDFSRHTISGGFSFISTREENRNGCIFYLDEVRYEN